MLFSVRFWTRGAGSLFLTVFIALFLRWAFVEPYVIPSGSMLPTLLIHDHIFVNKIIYGIRVPFSTHWLFEFAQPKRGEVIIFRYPEDPQMFYVKRVIGVPGDQIIYKQDNLFVNDQLVEKTVPSQLSSEWNWLRDDNFRGDGPGARNRYVHWEEKIGEITHSILLKNDERGNLVYGPYEVPPGHYFVLGDNRDNSLDSRFWEKGKQFVPRENLMGRASWIWLSCEDTLPYLKFLCNPLSIRWDRFFHHVQ